jgi:hypothetical protein
MAIAIGQITIIDVLDGVQGPTGPTGPQGPAGTPGFLGLIVSGSTLTLKGYDANGILQASVGYIYIDGNRYTVPQYSLTLTGTGQGYVLFNPNWTARVRFVKMIPDNSGIIYKDYNSLAVLDSSAYVIGQFQRDQVVYGTQILNPQSTEQFHTSHFMEILNSGDIDDINVWASALGVTQVFERIAAIEAFFNKLFTNEITMSGDGIIKSDIYEETNLIPTKGYKLIGLEGIIKAFKAYLKEAIIYDASIFGNTVIECSDGGDPVLKTQYGATGISKTIPSKTRWRGSDACSAVPQGASGNISSWGGSTAVYSAYKRTGGGYDGRLYLIKIQYDNTERSYTIKQAGIYKIYLRGQDSVGGSGTAEFYLNGVLTHSESNTNAYYTYEFSVGDVIRLIVNNIAEASLYFEEDALCLYGTGEFHAIYNVSNITYSTSLVITSVFTSTDTVAKVDEWINLISDGNAAGCTPSSSINIDGTPYVAKSIRRVGNSVTITTTTGQSFIFEGYADTTEPAHKGYYNVSGTITVVAETRGLGTGNVFPVGLNKDLGEAGNRYKNGYIEIVDANVLKNTANSSNVVYGAVFN